MRHSYIDLPAVTLRSLHSGFVDHMLGKDEEARDFYLAVLGGLSFKHFMLALQAEKLTVFARIVEDSAILGICHDIAQEEFDAPMFIMDGRQTGVDLNTLVIADTVDFDEQLRNLVGGDQ